MEAYQSEDFYDEDYFRHQQVNPNWVWWYFPGPWFFPPRPRPPMWGNGPWGPGGPWMQPRPPQPPRPRTIDDSTFM